MNITLELSPEVEAKLREGIERHDNESVCQLLADALAPTVETLLQQTTEQLPDEKFEVLANQLADEVAAHLEPNAPELSDFAVSRAGIYEDDP